MTDPSYPLYPVFSFLGFVLVLIPLPWHCQAWNSGTCLFMIWTALGCLNHAINSVVWHANAFDKAPIWCDISSRFMVGLAVGIPASSLCISRRLYIIASARLVHVTIGQKRRAVMEDLAIGLGIPVVQMGLQIVVEGHRYNIFEDVGCYPALFHTALAYPITLVWPLIIAVISSIYSVLTLRQFIKRRTAFREFLGSTISVNRYIRLMALSITEIVFNAPLCAICIAINYLTRPMEPWKGWADAHFEYSAVDIVPSFLWRNNFTVLLTIELDRWMPVFCAFLFFGFFGLAEEARKNYWQLYRSIAKRLRHFPSTRFTDGSARLKDSLPMAVTNTPSGILSVRLTSPPDLPKRDSLTSTIRPPSMGKSIYDSPMTLDFKMGSYTTSTLPPSPTSSRSTQDDVIDIINHPPPCALDAFDDKTVPLPPLLSTPHPDEIVSNV